MGKIPQEISNFEFDLTLSPVKKLNLPVEKSTPSPSRVEGGI